MTDDFSAWATARYGSLLHAAHLLTGDRYSAQDLVQTALVKTQLSWGRVRDNPDAYARRVLVTTHTDWWRKKPWRERSTDRLPESAGPDVLRTVDDRDALLTALQSLTPRQRAAVVLRHYHQLPEAEVADLLGCSIGTVKSTTSRALEALRHHPALALSKEES